MGRNFILLLFFLLNSLLGYSQELTPNLCQVYYGKVKSITILEPEVLSGSYVEFNEDLKIKSQIQQGNKIAFDWLNEGEIKCELFINDSKVETAYMYINEFSDVFYDFDAGDSNYKVWFKDNGSISHSRISNNGNTMETQYYYKSDTEMFPYKIVNRMGSQSQTIYVKTLKFDSKGNAIEYTQTSNGQTIRTKRMIEYY